MILKRITASDDLATLVNEINAAVWDDANEMSTYDEASLRTYLAHPDTLFVTCHRSDEQGPTLLGFASCRFELKPYEKLRWLYVDEVDVCADQRRQGAGKAIMQKLLEIAEEQGCDEVWLGTEVDNDAANGLYRSLDPDDVGDVVGYTWETD